MCCAISRTYYKFITANELVPCFAQVRYAAVRFDEHVVRRGFENIELGCVTWYIMPFGMMIPVNRERQAETTNESTSVEAATFSTLFPYGFWFGGRKEHTHRLHPTHFAEYIETYDR